MPIRSSVTVSLVPEARGGPFVFWDDLPAAVKTAKSLGFDAVEIFPPSPGAIDVDAVRTLLADHGLALAAMGTGAGWLREKLHLCLPDAANRAKAREFIRGIIDVAGELKAPAIIGSMQGRHGDGVDRDAAINYLTDALEDLGGHAAKWNVPLLYEPLNRYETNLVNNISSGVKLLEGVLNRNVKLLADLFHMNIEESEIDSAILAGGTRIGHLHFVDTNRCAAGMGHMDFAPIASALASIGYEGYASAEALPYPDPVGAAESTMAAFREFFRGQ